MPDDYHYEWDARRSAYVQNGADIDVPGAESARCRRDTLATLTRRLATAGRQLAVAERQIRDLARDNKRLKRELAELKSQ